jgi:nicotinamidase-related amidase
MTQSDIYRPEQHSTGLVVIDIQDKLRPAIASFDAVITEAVRLVRAFGILRMPVIVDALPPQTAPLVKNCFSCCGAEEFIDRLERTGITTLVLCGVETHVCIYQTALDLIARGHTVIAIANAMASRREPDHATALRRIELSGGIIMTVEMLLFDLLRTADAPDFREIHKLVK